MIRVLLFCISTILFNPDFLNAQSVPSPKEHFGFNIGDNYRLATYSQTEDYFKKIASKSDRVKLVEIGKTEEGRSQYMLIVSSPVNLQNLAKYKEISQKLARAEDLSDDQAKALAEQGKAVVWIDGGLHATETVGTHQLIETIWNFVSRNDAETKKILDEVIILFVHANPDGQELVSNWYMRHEDTLKRSLSHLPKLYQKYIGHDNNRDFYMMNMKETQNMSRQQYIEWMPQILYNHHQSGPPGSVVAGPPYRDPFNFAYDPILITSLDGVGAAMNNRLTVEGKTGYTSKSGSVFSTWWNGGLRTTAYFHNIIGLLTEIIGNPTPSRVPLVTTRLIPNNATPSPVTPQQWLFRQSIEYSVSLNYAVLDHAVRHREQLLYNIYKMGKNSIDAGNTDHWTLSPAKVEAVNVAMRNDARLRSNVSNESRDSVTMKYFNAVFQDPKQRDARGYIISADQSDFPTAVKFVNALIQSGIKIHKANSAFKVNGKTYPSGSYIVKTNQAFRPHVIDMFEPQDHPNDFLYPGGPPVRPYDAAGWTPAYSMGIQFDRIMESFDGPFQQVAYGELQTPVSNNKFSRQTAGYILDSRMNNSFAAVNELIKNGADVYRVKDVKSIDLKVGEGSFFVAGSSKTTDWLNKNSGELGLNVIAANRRPTQLTKVKKLRIGLWDTYGGSMPSGWLRWIFEQHNYDYKVIYAKEINAGKLKDKYDVIVFVGGAIPATTASPVAGLDTSLKPENIPAEFSDHIGRITADSSVPQLKKFMDDGGKIVTIGSSTNLAYHLKLPVKNALTEMNNGSERILPGEKHYIPGSILRVAIDSTNQVAWGMNSEADVYYSSSPVFKTAPDAISKGDIVPIAWFNSEKPLRSGWAYGQEYLQDGIAAFVAPVGKGKLYAFGPEITFRSQTHGTFKLLFNQLYGE